MNAYYGKPRTEQLGLGGEHSSATLLVSQYLFHSSFHTENSRITPEHMAIQGKDWVLDPPVTRCCHVTLFWPVTRRQKCPWQQLLHPFFHPGPWNSLEYQSHHFAREDRGTGLKRRGQKEEAAHTLTPPAPAGQQSELPVRIVTRQQIIILFTPVLF